MYDQTSEQLARAFRRAVFVDGKISMGEFMTRLQAYGDARVREAGTDAQYLRATERRETEPTTTG